MLQGDIEDDFKADLEAQPVLKVQKLMHDKGESALPKCKGLCCGSPVCMYLIVTDLQEHLCQSARVKRLHNCVS